MKIDTTIPAEHLAVTTERDDYVIEICQNKRVLHIGATDYPFTEDKYKNGQLLYAKLGDIVEDQIGIDNDEKSSAFLNKQNIKNSKIVVADMNAVQELNFSPEVIIFGETLEHLMNLETSLANLKKLMMPDTTMLISVPNALSFQNFLYAIRRKELQHPDHSVAFTYKTLMQLLKKNKFEITGFKFTFLDHTNAHELNWKGKISHALIRFFVKISPVFAPGLVVTVKK